MVLVDVEGLIRSWNPGAERVFGWKREEIVGQPIDVLFTPEDRAIGIPAEALEQANRLGRAGADRWQVRKDGTRFYAAGSVAPVRSGNETMPSYMALIHMILSDATQEKLAERVLHESGQVLREKAAPPTRSVLSRYGVPVGLQHSRSAALAFPTPLWPAQPTLYIGESCGRFRGLVGRGGAGAGHDRGVRSGCMVGVHCASPPDRRDCPLGVLHLQWYDPEGRLEAQPSPP